MILNFWNGEVFLDHTCNTHAHNSQAKSNVPHFFYYGMIWLENYSNKNQRNKQTINIHFKLLIAANFCYNAIVIKSHKSPSQISMNVIERDKETHLQCHY